MSISHQVLEKIYDLRSRVDQLEIIVNIDLITDINSTPEIVETFKTMIRPETNGLMRTPNGVTYRIHEIIYDYSKVVTMMTKTTGNVIAWCTCSIAPGFE